MFWCRTRLEEEADSLLGYIYLVMETAVPGLDILTELFRDKETLIEGMNTKSQHP